MECRKFDITLISANDLEDVRKIWNTEVYARVSIGCDPKTRKITPVDKHGLTNPAGNFTMKYTIGESSVQHHGQMLVIKLYCKRKLGDRYIGEVHVNERTIRLCLSMRRQCPCDPVQRGCVNSQGLLKFSYRFGERVSVDKLLLAQSIAVWM